jgi:hypothetical protein
MLPQAHVFLELLRAATVAIARISRREAMAVNKPVGDNARKGAVRKRSQLKTTTMGKKRWTKRCKAFGEFMAQKKRASSRACAGSGRTQIQESPGPKWILRT